MGDKITLSGSVSVRSECKLNSILESNFALVSCCHFGATSTWC
uniref:Uncharacterized protein n=1 Tax=Arundo donax TaxID=35708 RepID=A0A0A8YD98_ARUDO